MTELAKEYGDGLYALAAEEGLCESLHDELNALAGCLREEPDFIRLLDTRAIRLSERLDVIDGTLKDRAHPYILNFMKILCERGAIHAFFECVEWFHRRYNEDFGIAEAKVTTAVPLKPESASALRARLEAISGKRVVLMETVDPKVLGGVRVEMNGHRLDSTIQNRLERLRRELTGRE